MTILDRLAALHVKLSVVEPGRTNPALDYYDRRCVAAIEAAVCFAESVTVVMADDDAGEWAQGVEEGHNRVLGAAHAITR